MTPHNPTTPRPRNPLDIVVVGGGPWSPDTNFPIHHTARILSRDHRVLYLYRDSHVSLLGHVAGRLPGFHSWQELARNVFKRSSLDQVEEQLWVSPLSGLAAALPLSYPPALRAVSVRLVILQLRALLQRLDFPFPLLWFYWWFFPEIARAIPHRLAVYDIYDDHSQYDFVRSSPRRQQYTLKIEENLLHEVDLAFAVSHKLVREKGQLAKVHYLPNGVDIAVAKEAQSKPAPAELADFPRPIVGYLGSYDARMDWSLVTKMARARPQWSFVFVGGGDRPPSESLTNLHLLGNRPYPEALRYVKSFDVALIPFVLDPLTEAVCPAKLFDYLALGKPVLSTPLPAIQEVVGEGDEVYRGTTAQDFLALADRALSEDPALKIRRTELAGSLTWEHRVTRAMQWVEDALLKSGEVA
jgi:glycosyltransferase involved in cell wall biosynthesis